MTDLQIYADMGQMAGAVAGHIAADLAVALADRGAATLVVPGGTTPGPVFDALAGAAIDWARVTVTLSDERWVPEGDARSNAAQVRARLLVGRAAVATFLPLYRDGNPDDRLAEVAAALTPHLPATVVLLGMGADMHVASLFPGAEASVLHLGAPVLAMVRGQGQGLARVTLTLPVLRAARAVHLVVTGADKRAALDRAAGLTTGEAPVAGILDVAAVHWAP